MVVRNAKWEALEVGVGHLKHLSPPLHGEASAALRCSERTAHWRIALCHAGHRLYSSVRPCHLQIGIEILLAHFSCRLDLMSSDFVTVCSSVE